MLGRRFKQLHLIKLKLNLKFQKINCMKLFTRYAFLLSFCILSILVTRAQKPSQDSTKTTDSSAKKTDSLLNKVVSGVEELKKQLKDEAISDKEPMGIIS